MSRNPFAYAVPIVDDRDVSSRGSLVSFPTVPSFHVSYPQYPTAMDVEYADNEFLDVIEILAHPELETGEGSQHMAVEATPVATTATGAADVVDAYPLSDAEFCEGSDEDKEYEKYLASLEGAELVWDGVNVVEAEEFKWNDEPFPSHDKDYTAPGNIASPLVSTAARGFDSGAATPAPQAFDTDDKQSFRQSAIGRWHSKKLRRVEKDQDDSGSRSRSNSTLSLAASVAQLQLQRPGTDVWQPLSSFSAPVPHPQVAGVPAGGMLNAEAYRENRAAYSYQQTDHISPHLLAEHDVLRTPTIPSRTSQSSASSVAPLNPRQQATAKRQREKGKFKKATINWVSVTDLFS